MSLATSCAGILAGAFLLMTATASAQAPSHDHDHEPGRPVVCGTHAMQADYDREELLENTRRANPGLYARIMSKSAAGRGIMASSQYLEYNFLVRNRVTNQLEDIQGALVYEGPYSRVWVDVRDTGKASHKPTSQTMRTLFKALDSAVVQTNTTPRNRNQGILKNDIDVFGEIPERYRVENKTDFLLLDIKDAVAGQNVLGYFSPTDQSEDDESNRMNLLYIDSKEGFNQLQTLLAIIAHEFQHLIHFGRHPRSGGDAIARDVVINEGMSEVASILNGYHFRSNAQYLANTNISFFEWHYSEATAQEIDYQRAMTFAHYLSEQYGERFLYELVGSPKDNMERVTDALQRYGMPEGYDYREVLKGFAVANYLQSSSNPAFRYNFKLKGGAARPHKTSTGSGFPADGNAAVQAYGTYYLQYTNPGPMRIRFTASNDIRIMMIGVRSGDTTVVELPTETDHTLPIWAGGAYSKVAFAIINTAGGVREANWTATALTSAVDDETGAGARLAFDGVAANGDGSSTLIYSVPASAPVRIELYNARGERVRTVVDGDARSAGTHREAVDMTGLPSGTYVARLVQNGGVASQLVFVAR